MSVRETYHWALVRACLAVGDEVALAKQLHVPLPSLVGWLLGDAPVPAQVFLCAVDLLIAANRQTLVHNQEFLERSEKLLDELRKRHRPG